LFIPPPKYHVTSLVDCELADRSHLDALVIMERGTPIVAEQPGESFTLERLLENTDDAYTFPPFSEMAPKLVLDGLDYPALRERERELLAAAIEPARRFRVRIEGHGWSDVIPDLLDRTEIPAALASSPPTRTDGGSGHSQRAPVGIPIAQPSGATGASSRHRGG
jgi:hypothetical protein